MNLQELQKLTKNWRNFDVEKLYKAKIEKITSFFKENKLDSVVLGISGGIDSAVVFYLLNAVKRQRDSPLKQVLPISMPIKGSEGVTGQEDAANNAQIVIESLDYSYYEVNLEDASSSIVWNSCDVFEDHAWAIGQMNSVLRTPVLYYHAAILQTAGYKSVVSGTINRDEGSYIGFFGKASDAMVDIQPIADLHKSEVYALAEYMGVPRETIERTPRGDVWDNRVDEEMIGAPYWFLEMYLNIKSTIKTEHLDLEVYCKCAELDQESTETFIKYALAIENIHNINKHKYQVGNPAHFLDVLDRKIPGGWS